MGRSSETIRFAGTALGVLAPQEVGCTVAAQAVVQVAAVCTLEVLVHYLCTQEFVVQAAVCTLEVVAYTLEVAAELTSLVDTAAPELQSLLVLLV